MMDFLDDIDGFLNAEEDIEEELRRESEARHSSFVADDDRYEEDEDLYDEERRAFEARMREDND